MRFSCSFLSKTNTGAIGARLGGFFGGKAGVEAPDRETVASGKKLARNFGIEKNLFFVPYRYRT